MKKSTVLIAAALLGSAGLTVAAGTADTQKQKNGIHKPKAPGKRADGKYGGMPHGFDSLNLSEAQKTKIKAIMDTDRPQPPAENNSRRAEFQQKMEQRRAKVNQLLTAKNFDEQAARNMIAERQQERAALEREQAERELQMLKKRHAVFQVLTPAQQKQFLENQNKQDQRRRQGPRPAEAPK